MKTVMKRSFSILLALVMVFSLTVPAFAADAVCTCQAGEGSAHLDSCPLYQPAVEPEQQPEPNTCTGAEDCSADSHNEGCLSQKQPEQPPVDVVPCNKELTCPATEHEAECLKAAADAADAKKLADITSVQAMLNALTTASTAEELYAVEAAIQNLVDTYGINPQEVLILDNLYLNNNVPNGNVASAGGIDYPTLAEAINAASTAADKTVTLLESVTLDDKATLSLVGITLDLNQQTLTLNGESGVLRDATIKNGSIVISRAANDSIADGLFYTYGNTAINGVAISGSNYSIYAVFNIKGGTLDIDSSSFNLSNNDVGSGGIIYFNETEGVGSMTMDNCTVDATNPGDFICNGIATLTNCTINLKGTVKDGLDNGINGTELTMSNTSYTVDGAAGRGITSDGSPISIENGSVITMTNCGEAGILFKYTGSINVDSSSTIAETNIYVDNNATTSTINGTTISNDKDNKMLVSVSNGKVEYTVKKLMVDSNGTYFDDLNKAFKDGVGTITLLESITLSAPVTVTGTVNLELDGKTISYTSTTPGEAMITNNGTLNIIDSGSTKGKLFCEYTGNAVDPGTGSYGNYTIVNNGSLSMDGVTAEMKCAHVNGAHMHCVLDNRGSASATLNNCNFTNNTYRSIRMSANSTSTANTLTINGGKYVGQVWLQSPNSNANKASLSINGGSFTPTGTDFSSVFLEAANASVSFAVTDGQFNGKIGQSGNMPSGELITGGSFAKTAGDNTNTALFATGYGLVPNGEGYGVEELSPVASLISGSSSKNYYSLDEAINAAMTGDTIKLLAEVKSYSPIAIPAGKDITINMNGNDISILEGTLVFDNKGTVTLMAEGNINVSFDINGDDDVMNALEMLEAANQVAYSLDKLKLADGSAVTFAENCISIIDSDDMPAPPTATVTEIENEDLTYAMNFLAEDVTPEQLAAYSLWFADYELTVNKDVVFNAYGSANDDVDGWLSGQYEGFGWIPVPFENTPLAKNTPIKIMKYAADMIDPGLKFTYGMVYELVKDFNCGIFFKDSFLNDPANVDLQVKLELRMYNPLKPDESIVIGEYSFANPNAVVSLTSGGTTTYYDSFDKAYEAAQAGDTITLYQDINTSSTIVIDKAITIEGVKNGVGAYPSINYSGSGENARAININCAGDVTIRNLTINAEKAQRAINVIQKTVNLTLENVSAEATYAVNVAASSKNSTIEINNSALTGYAAVNVKSNATVEVNDSTLTGKPASASADKHNEFAVIAIGDPGVNATVTVNGGKVIAAYDEASHDPYYPGMIDGAADVAGSSISFNNTQIVKNSGVPDVKTYLFYIDTTGKVIAYNSLSSDSFADMVSKLSQSKDNTIYMTRDISIASPYEIAADLTINANGHKITKASDVTSAFSLADGAVLRITGETGMSMDEVKALVPDLCVTKGSYIIQAHDFKYENIEGENKITQTCNNHCDHKAIALIDYKDAKKTSAPYTGAEITDILELSFVAADSSKGISSWAGAAPVLSYKDNVDPSTATVKATGTISIGGVSASKTFEIEPAELKSEANSKFYRDSGKSLKFTIETDGKYFPGAVSYVGIYNNANKLVATVAPASLNAYLNSDKDIVIAIPASVMATLGTGRYTMKAELVSLTADKTDGDSVVFTAYTSCEFRVRYPVIIPSTGDPANFLLWGGLLLAATAALGGTLIVLKKSKKQK